MFFFEHRHTCITIVMCKPTWENMHMYASACRHICICSCVYIYICLDICIYI